ncbi:MAG TPA: TetR/AcrR family transcriptional regulator [Solirubrobacterales bacterium]|jgi:AcrR family transcriptional regulator|nr:TetR/AcrR family transcriptional regulator [Solirubrobacterales bacterium]
MAPAEPPPSRGESERFEPGAITELSAELALSRLPPGRHGLPRSFVDRNQRLRLIAAMLAVLSRHGYPGTTVSHVTREAGVSRASFYSQFASKEECFLATYDLAASWLCERVERAVTAVEEWPAGVSAGVAEALRLLAANPPVARLIAVESLQAGPVPRRRQQACLGHFAEALRAGRPGHFELPADLEELLLGGVISLIGRYVDTGRTEQLPEATVELVHYLLIPYLEPGETRRIAAQAA